MKYDAITSAAINLLVKGRRRLGESPSAEALRVAIEAKYPGAIERAQARSSKEAFDSKFIGPVPDWAKRYVAKYGGNRVSSLTIRQSRIKAHTSGHCWYSDGRLVVTLSMPGSDVREQQSTVLHEIAHTYATYDQHGDHFYAEWYRLLKAENLYRYTLGCGRFVGGSSLRSAARRARR